jgi:hypothetical protein
LEPVPYDQHEHSVIEIRQSSVAAMDHDIPQVRLVLPKGRGSLLLGLGGGSI